MGNDELKDIYNRIYREGEERFFSKFAKGKDISEANRLVLSAMDWTGKRVLDIGCGAGHLAALIADCGASSVTGIDYAQEAVQKAKILYSRENLTFHCKSLEEWTDSVDCVVSMGTLEHMDDPNSSLKRMVSHLTNEGKIILTCPCFINLRGIVWMTLQLLQKIPMSLTDIHFISPFDIEAWAREAGMMLERVDSCDFSKGNADQMLVDLKKRLANALRDANIDNSNVDVLLNWLEKVSAYMGPNVQGVLMGATGFYVLCKSAAPTA
jgi:ubiquinone biosynthesis O-methyltransferase